MQQHQPNFATAGSVAPAGASGTSSDHKRGKKRGSYNCGRCGLPKKGHNCHVNSPIPPSAATPIDSSVSTFSAVSESPTRQPPLRQPYSYLRRALSFDDAENQTGGFDPLEPDHLDAGYPDSFNVDSCGWPVNILWDVLRRLPPTGLLSAANVCKGWNDTARRVWRAAEELRLRVPVKAQLGFVASILQKCTSLARLSLRMESNVDSTMLACIAFSCPNLEFMEISTSNAAINRINGEELGRFVADKQSLKILKVEGCSNLGGFVLCSSSLTTVWLSDLFSLSKMVFNCPQLREISLEFSRKETDSTDLTTVVDGLGRSCPKLQNIHIASARLSHAAVLALTAAQLRGLRMLSLVLGSEITDASVAAITSNYPDLELLDLSGSSVSDSGIGMICNVFPETLSRLLLALCPNVTSSGIQFATAQLPHLELMDCGMTICDPNCENRMADKNNRELPKASSIKLPLVNQKLIIKHSRLKKLSLWGCAGLDALYLNCPQLDDLNLNSCTNLHPDRLLLQCPSLVNVHASGCRDILVGAIQSQVCNAFTAMESLSPSKRLPDGSKRIQVPYFHSSESPDETKKRRRIERRLCNVIVD
ncbi:F-box/LRR-repeat protein 17-like [Neltuma alba]|uniref:F-box/LRR-repeat protein 17-like n=1 Tax=Neltuma alba TaxID=207710 RepID=UPI0010A54F20|nr:F-box/LRR-repeat protein 17-like [Prosopis alba]